MPDAAAGTKVGNVYLDLLVRDTITKQVQAMAGKAQAAARQQFADVGKAAGDAAAKGLASVSAAMNKTVSGAFNKSAATIQARIKALERDFDRAAIQMDAMWARGARPGTAGFDKLTAQQQKITDQIAYLRDRLAIEVQAAAQKQAAAEQAAYAKAAQAAEQAAARQQAAARTAHTTAAPPAGEQLLGSYANGTLAGSLQDRLRQFNEVVTGPFGHCIRGKKCILGSDPCGQFGAWRAGAVDRQHRKKILRPDRRHWTFCPASWQHRVRCAGL